MDVANRTQYEQPNPGLDKVSDTITSLKISTISKERKIILQPLIEFVQEKVLTKQNIQLNFICTHNSRRSHLAQIWAQVIGFHFKINNLSCFSGGTEATALFPKVVEVLESQGFKIDKTTNSENPIYNILYAKILQILKCFQKN